MKTKITSVNTKRRNRNSGFSLIELLIAMVVLTIGVLGGMIILLVAIASNGKSRFDTAAVALAQSTMDRITVLSSSSNSQSTSVTDCKGVVHAMTTTGGDYATSPGAPLIDLSGIANGAKSIDFTAAPVAGYQMTYTLCAQGATNNTGIDQVYDVRWNIINTVAGDSSTQIVMVAAKNVNEGGNGMQGQSKYFSIPITLRGIRGN